MVLRLIHYLRGYVSLLLSGQFLERFFNICMHRGIFLWDIRRQGSDSARVSMSLRAFKTLPPIARKTRTRVKILKKSGLPIRLAAYKKRTFFLLGLLLAVSFLYASSLFIWSVELVGALPEHESTIRTILAENGVYPGAYKRRLQVDKIKNDALAKLDNLSWLWVDVRGCRATVRVQEKRPAPEILSTDPCDIIALCDGVIAEIHATEGHKAVKVGDTVRKGQLLISAVMPSERINARWVHAAGVVYARTWYEESINVPLTETKKIFTGETKTQRTLFLGKWALPLSSGKSAYTHAERTKQRHDWCLFGIYTGISYQSETIAQYKPETVALPKDKAVQAAEAVLDARIADALCDKDGVRTDVRTDVIENTDGTLTVVRTAEYKEQIGVEVGVEKKASP